MDGRRIIKNAAKTVAASAAIAAAGYAALVVFNRAQYGKVKGFAERGKDSLLDRFIPDPEVAEHHQIDINAPADVVMATAREFRPSSRRSFARSSRRELALGGTWTSRSSDRAPRSDAVDRLVCSPSSQAGRWCSAVTQPWQAAPVFPSVPAAEFRDFAEPGYVKIAWTLRADPIDVFRWLPH
jgi:hypothetical protein